MSLTDLLKYIVPPQASAQVTPWRWVIVVAVLLLLTNAGAGRGFLGGYGGYAAQQDVQIILELQYAATIVDLYEQICSMRPGRNQAIETALEDYQRRYASITGRRYPLRACEG